MIETFFEYMITVGKYDIVFRTVRDVIDPDEILVLVRGIDIHSHIRFLRMRLSGYYFFVWLRIFSAGY